MKKQSKKSLVLSKEILRTLEHPELERVIGGAGGSLGATAQPYTCTCPPAQE